MDSKKDDYEVICTLLRIEQRLDEVASLLKLGQRGQIEQIKTALLNSNVRKNVYGLCDGNHSVSEMAAKLNKKGPNISRALRDLEEAGLIREVRLGRVILYERLI